MTCPFSPVLFLLSRLPSSYSPARPQSNAPSSGKLPPPARRPFPGTHALPECARGCCLLCAVFHPQSCRHLVDRPTPPSAQFFSPVLGETCFCFVARYTRTEFTQPRKPQERALLSHSLVRPQVPPRLAGKEPGR